MYIVISPYCSFEPEKNWQNMTGMIENIKEPYYLIGTKEEGRGYPDKPQNLMGKTTIEESINLLKAASLYIGNDTGFYHIAANLGVKTIAVFTREKYFFRCAHMNLPNVRIMYRPTIQQVLDMKDHMLYQINYRLC